MITKILLTLVVIAVAFIYLKRRKGVANKPVRQVPAPTTTSEADLPIKMIAIILLVASFIATAGFVSYRWYDGQRLLEVKVVEPNRSELVYRVYKADLQERSFTTTDGQIIRISAQERLEIKRLEN